MIGIRRAPVNALMWLAFAAFACRALAPVGYMPAPIAEGGPYVLCPSGAQTELVRFLTGTTGQHGSHSHHGEQTDAAGHDSGDEMQFCPLGASFAAAAAADPATTSPDPIPRAIVIRAHEPAYRAAPGSRYQSRAPPHSLNG